MAAGAQQQAVGKGHRLEAKKKKIKSPPANFSENVFFFRDLVVADRRCFFFISAARFFFIFHENKYHTWCRNNWFDIICLFKVWLIIFILLHSIKEREKNFSSSSRFFYYYLREGFSRSIGTTFYGLITGQEVSS